MTRARFLAVAAVAIAASALYVYRGLFGLDFTDIDTFPLIATGRFESLDDVRVILSSPLMQGLMPNALFYRPLSSLSWGLDYRVWGLEPLGYHLTDLGLHVANSLLLFWIVLGASRLAEARSDDERVGASDVAAFVAGLIFAIHPLGMETVPAIARRPDLLFAWFLLLTLGCLLRHLRRGGFGSIAGAAFFCLLGLASKDTAIVIPAVAAAFVFCFSTPDRLRDRARAALRATWPLVGVAGLFALQRSLVLGGLGGYAGLAGTRLDAMLRTFDVYGCAALVPGDLDSCAAIPGWLRIGALILLAAPVVVWGFRARGRGGAAPIFFAVYCIAILFGLHGLASTPAAARTLYVWTLFVSIAWGSLLVRLALTAARGPGWERGTFSGAATVALAVCVSILRGAWSGAYVEEWNAAGAVASRALAGSAEVLRTLAPGSVVQLVNLPYAVGREPLALRERPILLEHSVQGWADLRFPDKRLRIVGLSYLQVRRDDPAQLDSSVRFDPETGRLEIAVGRGGRATAFPWNNRYGARTRWHAAGYESDGAGGLTVQLHSEGQRATGRVFLVYLGDRVELRGSGPWQVRSGR